jgi:hypothetical protein
MSAGTVKGYCLVIDSVDQEPVWLNMALSVPAPISTKIVWSAIAGSVTSFADCINDKL